MAAQRIRLLLTALTLALVAVAVTAGFLMGNRGAEVAAQPQARVAPSTGGTTIPYDLATHCGIDEARLGDVYYEADHPLVVRPAGAPGNPLLGDPPPGWATPVQPGTMTVLGPSRAVFRDHAGHEVYFHARQGATGFLNICD